MENQNQSSSSTHTVLGIISLVVGVLGFIFCFIPCLGAYAIFAGVAGIICGVIGIILAKKANAGIAVALIGLIFSIIATLVAFWQLSALSAIGNLR